MPDDRDETEGLPPRRSRAPRRERPQATAALDPHSTRLARIEMSLDDNTEAVNALVDAINARTHHRARLARMLIDRILQPKVLLPLVGLVGLLLAAATGTGLAFGDYLSFGQKQTEQSPQRRDPPAHNAP